MEYYIIYDYNGKNKLDLVYANSYEKDDYKLASRRSFEEEHEASRYAIDLAEEHNLEYIGPKFDEYNNLIKHDFLD